MVDERTLLCKQCRKIFKLPSHLLKIEKEKHCPECGSFQVEEPPVWAPLGSGLNIFDEMQWEYQCQQCQKTFNMPIPKSPAENNLRHCPYCGSGKLNLLTVTGGQPLYCG